MEIGNKVKVIHNFFKDSHVGTVTEIEVCFFRIITSDNTKITYHWNDVENIEILESN